MFLDVRAFLASTVAAVGLALLSFALGSQIYFVRTTPFEAVIDMRRDSAAEPKPDVAVDGNSGQAIASPLAAGPGRPVSGALDGNVTGAIPAAINERLPIAATPALAGNGEARTSGVGGPFVPVPVAPLRATKEPATASLTTPTVGEPEPAPTPAAKKPLRRRNADTQFAPRRPIASRPRPAHSSNPFKQWFDNR